MDLPETAWPPTRSRKISRKISGWSSASSQAHRSAAYCRSGGNDESPPAAVEEAGPDRPAVRGGTPPQVVSVTDVVNRKRADGSGTRIVEALLADATGCILMSARNEKGERPVPSRPRRDSAPARRPAALGSGTDAAVTIPTCFAADELKAGETIKVAGGKIEMFKGTMRLAVDKAGGIQPAAEKLAGAPNTANNVSNVQFDLVELK